LHTALGGPFTKSTCFDPSGHLKNGKCIFYVETRKTLVAKVVGNANMHISTKNGTMVPKFAVELAQTMVIWQGRPRELLPGSTSLLESPHVNPWDGMFDILTR
jgi:hypothetical protein